MKRSFSMLLALCLGLMLSFGLAGPASAKEKKQKSTSTQEEQLSGRIHMINKDTSTITLQKGRVQRHVVYNNKTKITYRNSPASMNDVKEGRRVICLGKYDEKNQLVASGIDVREGR